MRFLAADQLGLATGTRARHGRLLVASPLSLAPGSVDHADPSPPHHQLVHDAEVNEPWTPVDDGMLGKSLRRVEDRRLLTGAGRFVADLAEEATLHASFVRSQIPHGRISSIDLGDVADQPGIVAVFVADDLGLADIPGGPPGPPEMSRPPLARDRVRYVGEPFAVIIGTTKVVCADGADRVWAHIDPLPVVVDARDAIDGTPLFPNGNVALRHAAASDPARPLPDLPVQATVEVTNQRLAPLAIEGLAILAEPLEEGSLRVTCSHQAPHRLRERMAAALAMAIDSVHVVVPDVGGAFGMKGMFYPEYVVVAAAALRLRRPVMWVESRREHFLSGTHGRGQTHRVTLGGDSRGRIERAHIEILADTGAYPHNGALIPSLSRFVATGPYDIENVVVESTAVVTNRAPTGSYRGAGRPEAAFALERAVDVFARKAGLDPVAVRMTNFIRKEALPYETAMGATYDSGDYAAALARAVELAGIDEVRTEQQRRRTTGADPIGIGIGAFIERAGGAIDSGEFAEVELSEMGRATVRTGSTSGGQGHETVWSQALSEVFSIDPALVTVVAGDTTIVADGVGTFGSRSAQAGAAAAFRMARVVRGQAAAVAAEMLEASPDDLRLEGGHFEVVGVPGMGVSLAAVVAHAIRAGVSLRASEMFVPGAQTFPYGAHVAVVEVELATGEVTLGRFIAVDDCGNLLNPMIVEGQVYGSLTQGIGQALLEGIEYSPDGTPLTTTMMDYLIPAAADMPRITTDRLCHPAPSNPLGVKGTGEAGCIGAPPAIVNAVLDALAPYGVTDLQMPLLPHRVWEALQTARRSP